MKKLINDYPIWSFLIINYLISWSFLYPSYQIVLANGKITPLSLIGLIGAYGPTIAAIIVQSILDRKKLNALFKSLLKVKTKIFYVLFLIITPIILYFLAYLSSTILFNGSFSFNWIAGISNIPLLFLAALPFGPMGEELGWRGFMLPKLLEKNSVIKSTFYVGLAWGIWHLASFTFPGAALPSYLDVSIWSIALYFVNTIALSFTFTFIYFKTNGSVFYAILLHAFFNIASDIAENFLGETTNFSILLTAYTLNIILAGIFGFLLIRNQKPNLIRN